MHDDPRAPREEWSPNNTKGIPLTLTVEYRGAFFAASTVARWNSENSS
jgi:hypothetical protein